MSFMDKFLSIVIPSNRDYSDIEPLLKCIINQDIDDWKKLEVLIIWDKKQLTKKIASNFLNNVMWIFDNNKGNITIEVIHELSWHRFVSGQWLSYVRNTWIRYAQGKFIYLIDDDNVFWNDFLRSCIKDYIWVIDLYKAPVIWSPTILYRKTNNIQSVWFGSFIYTLSWPRPIIWFDIKAKNLNLIVDCFCSLFCISRFKQNDMYYFPVIIWANSLLSKSSILKKYLFDEEMWMIYEDLDMTMKCYRQWVVLAVSKNIGIHHMERPKNIIQKSYIQWSFIYFKSRNRLLFVRHHSTVFEFMLFVLIWLPLHTMYLFVLILCFSSNRCDSLFSMIKWLRDWMK